MIERQLLEMMNDWALVLVLTLSIVYLISGTDDAVVDFIAWLLRLKPEQLAKARIRALHSQPEKRIAIMVPAWDEGNIIDRMLKGNLKRIDYHRYDFFIGVYPNDRATVDKVLELQQRFTNIFAVINDRPGPTSKGQILNYVIQFILQQEKTTGKRYHAFHMQDSEDLIHPKALKLVNDKLNDFDFIQIPVFSLPVRGSVAGTYMDEFAESHTKDILVRARMGAAVPSAGVGTTLSRRLILSALREKGEVYHEKSLTEDYELGITAHALGFRSTIAVSFYKKASGKNEFIATREYFPKHFSRSIRQKTRWTTGIALQGWRHLGWMGSFWNRYFLARDRKGVFTNFATFLGYPTLIFTGWYAWEIDPQPMGQAIQGDWVGIMAINFSLMTLRFYQRSKCVARVYGFKAALPVAFRWPVGITVNALAGLRAVRDDLRARFTNYTLSWSKTEHELPELFGQAAEVTG